MKEQGGSLIKHTLQLDYSYWTAEDILKAVLPESLCENPPTGFAITGHIAHLNLNKEYLPYKHLIGAVVLDKNNAIRTVVNKLDSIDTQFRFFKMELLAGEPDYVVEHHESNCRFTFDFTEVYWNSRLHHEHERLVNLFDPTDVIVDVFAGVGPFAVPAGRKGCAVLANDLNPNSAKYLRQNIINNKVDDVVRARCEDGRDVIRNAMTTVAEQPFPPYTGPRLSRMEERRKHKEVKDKCVPSVSPAVELPARRRITQFVMNLPDTAIEFLDAFRGVLSPTQPWGEKLQEIYGTAMPVIHCYCFTRELEFENARSDISQRVAAKLGHTIEDFDLHLVRSVAPNKDMYCISFRLPREVALNN